MRAKLIVLASLTLILLSSCAATFKVTWTTPAYRNDGDCTNELKTPAPLGLRETVHLDVTGAFAFIDSIITTSGTSGSYTKSVPSGTYTIRAWVSDSTGNSCDTTITRTFFSPWGKVRIQ